MTDGQPKYLNSSDTVVFNKRRNLYGLSLCKNLKAKTLHLVEGYIDVVSLVSHGVQGCVATLGTAITAEQAQLLKRYTSHVTICYDGDEAGQKATERALQIFEFAGMQTDVCIIPNRQDPDDFVKANGAQAFLALQRMTGTAFLLGPPRRSWIFLYRISGRSMPLPPAKSSSPSRSRSCWKAICAS
jgi:DNA primase